MEPRFFVGFSKEHKEMRFPQAATFLALVALLAPSASFAGETVVHCPGKKWNIEAQLPEREKVTLKVNKAAATVHRDGWVFAMNRRGEAIVPEEVVLSATTGKDTKLEVRFENLRLCGDIEGVRVRVFEEVAGDRTFLEETSCTCKPVVR